MKDTIRQLEEVLNFVDDDELICDTIPLKIIDENLCRFLENGVNATKLSLNCCNIKEVQCLPKLPNITSLELESNYIQQIDCNEIVKCFPNLELLCLSGNPLKNINDLKPLTKLPSLNELIIQYTHISEVENYRGRLFEMLPQVSVIDGRNIMDESVEEVSEFEDEDDSEGVDSSLLLKNFYNSNVDDMDMDMDRDFSIS